MKYTLDEVKNAFWSTFHETGEILFPYAADDPERNQQITDSWFNNFVETLNLGLLSLLKRNIVPRATFFVLPGVCTYL